MPPVERVAGPEKAVELAKLANDGMAELVLKYPERFVAAIGCLPMNDMDAALEEADRAINDLRFRGIQIASSINKKPLDSPEFLPLYEKMHQYDL
jgi:aminocarboxymuconate-semialdehyde decarboxylase